MEREAYCRYCEWQGRESYCEQLCAPGSPSTFHGGPPFFAPDVWKMVETLATAAAPCPWAEDQDGNWWTGCDNGFVFGEGTPRENGFRYCLYCGRPLLERLFAPAEPAQSELGEA